MHDFDLGIEERHQLDDYVEAIGDPSRFDEIVFCGFGEPTLRLKLLLAIQQIDSLNNQTHIQ